MSQSVTVTSAEADRRDQLLPFMLLLFVGSGCAALVYEIVWLQMLQLLVGATGISLGVLLGTFMGGMCLGSLLLSRVVSNRFHPLVVYAVLELGIAVCGVGLWYVFPMIGEFYTGAFSGGQTGIMMRGLVAAICLLPPTLLMGATLPAIARWVESTPRGVSWLGYFYGGNIVGAVFGCLLAGFYLLRVFDMQIATFVAAGINVVVAFIAFGLALLARHEPEESVSSSSAGPLPGAMTVYLTIALSGLTALGAEVVWTRLLSLMMGGTVYTFSIILAVFLTGLGAGSSFGAMLAGSVRSARWSLGTCQMLVAAAIAWTAYMLTFSLPYWPIDPALAAGVSNHEMAPWYMFQLDFARALFAIFPGTFLWGASFPLALGAVTTKGQDAGSIVGRVYAANTVGAILGATLFSMWIIPAFGTAAAQQSLIVLALVSSAVALVPLLIPAPAVTGSLTRNAPSGVAGPIFVTLQLCVAIAAGLFAATQVKPMPWEVVAYGRQAMYFMNNDSLIPGVTALEDIPTTPDYYKDLYCRYVGEGMNVSVAVTLSNNGQQCFHGAGKVQASNLADDMRLQRLLGHVSALAHPNPENVLVVACGAGVTAGSFVVHPETKRIVICDIEPLVPTTVTPMFTKENYGIVDKIKDENPTKVKYNDVPEKEVQVYYDDGRHYIRTTKEMFDVITSDPIDPWVKGCAALNTVEYYQMCKDHLKEGGVMSLWIPLYESNPETIKSVLMTFFQVFPNGIIWSNDVRGEGYDAVLFGVKDTPEKPFKIDLDALTERWNDDAHAELRISSADVGFYSPEDMLATYAGSAKNLQAWGADAQINTDRNLRLQYLAGMAFNAQMGTKILNSMLEHYEFPKELFTGSEDKLRRMELTLDAMGRSRYVKKLANTGTE